MMRTGSVRKLGTNISYPGVVVVVLVGIVRSARRCRHTRPGPSCAVADGPSALSPGADVCLISWILPTAAILPAGNKNPVLPQTVKPLSAVRG